MGNEILDVRVAPDHLHETVPDPASWCSWETSFLLLLFVPSRICRGGRLRRFCRISSVRSSSKRGCCTLVWPRFVRLP